MLKSVISRVKGLALKVVFLTFGSEREAAMLALRTNPFPQKLLGTFLGGNQGVCSFLSFTTCKNIHVRGKI